jgi:quercetin dioxygenase-like cupin family protein
MNDQGYGKIREVVNRTKGLFVKLNTAKSIHEIRAFLGEIIGKPVDESTTVFTTLAGTVLFEPGARSTWHLHPAGQILIVISGVDYHQIKGEPREVFRKGDVVQCPPDKVHWHGASENSSMSHIYIIPNTEKVIVEWMDPGSDEDYAGL